MCETGGAMRDGNRLAHNPESQVRILSPLPAQTAPGESSGGRLHAACERICEHKPLLIVLERSRIFLVVHDRIELQSTNQALLHEPGSGETGRHASGSEMS